MFLKKRTFFKTIFIPSIERIKFHRGFIYFKRVRLIKYDIYSWTNYSKNFCAKVDYKPILNISLTDSIDWKSAIRNLRTPERKYSARIKAIKIRTKEKQSKRFKESTVSGSLSNTRDPGNNGFIHQEFPCRIDHYNAMQSFIYGRFLTRFPMIHISCILKRIIIWWLESRDQFTTLLEYQSKFVSKWMCISIM